MVDDELEGGNPSPSPSASAPHGSDSCRNSKENSHGHDDTANVLLALRSKQTPAAQADNDNMDELESSRLRPSASEPRDSDDDRNSKPNSRDDINRSSTQQNGTSEQFDSDVNASDDPSTNSSGKRNVLGLDDLSMNPSMIALTTVEVKQGDKTIILTGNINQTDPQNSILHGVQRSGVGSKKRDLVKRINSSTMICVLVPKMEKEEEGDERKSNLVSAYNTGQISPQAIEGLEYYPLATDSSLVDMVENPDTDMRAFFAAEAFTTEGQELISKVGKAKGWFYQDTPPTASTKADPYERFREYKERFQKQFRFYVFWLEGNNRSIAITCLFNKVMAMKYGSVVLDDNGTNLLTRNWCDMDDSEYDNWKSSEMEPEGRSGDDVMDAIYTSLQSNNNDKFQAVDADVGKPVTVMMMCLAANHNFKTANQVEEVVFRAMSKGVAKDKQDSSTSTSSQVIGRMVFSHNKRQRLDKAGKGGGKYLIKSEEFDVDKLLYKPKDGDVPDKILQHPFVIAMKSFLESPDANAQEFLENVKLVGTDGATFTVPAKATVTNLFRPENAEGVQNTPLDFNSFVVLPLIAKLLAEHGKGKEYSHIEVLHVALGDIGMNSGSVHKHNTTHSRVEELGRLDLDSGGCECTFWNTVLFLADLWTVTGSNKVGEDLFGAVMDKMTDLERDKKFNFEAVLGRLYGLIQHASQRLQTTISKGYYNGPKKNSIPAAKLGRLARLAIVKDVAVVVKGKGFDFKINPSLETNEMWSEVDEDIKNYVRFKAEPKGVVPEQIMKKLMMAINKSLQVANLQNPIRFANKTTSTDRPAFEIAFCLWMLQLECDDRFDPESKLHPYSGRRYQDNDLKMHVNREMRQVDNFLDLAPVTYPGMEGFLSLGLFVSLASASQANSTDTSPLIQALARVIKKKGKSQMGEEKKTNAKKGSGLKRKASKSKDTSATAKKKQAVGESKADTHADANTNEENAKMSGSGSEEDQIAKFFKEMKIKFDNSEEEKEMIRSLVDRITDNGSDKPGETVGKGASDSIAGVTNDNGGEESEDDDMDTEESEDEDDEESSDVEFGEDCKFDSGEAEERSFINNLLESGDYPQMKDKNDSVRLSLSDTIRKGHLRSIRSNKKKISKEDDAFITFFFETDTNVDQRETNLKKYAEQFNVVVKCWFADKKGQLQSKTFGETESETTESTRPMHIYVNQQYQPEGASEPTVLKGYALLTDRIRRSKRLA